MSTEILDFADDEEDLQMQDFRLYLMIALPATTLTLIGWYSIYDFVKTKARSNDWSKAAGGA